MASEQVRIVLTAQDNASAVINNVSRNTENLFSKLAGGIGTGIGFAVVNQAMSALSSTFSTLTDSVIGFNASLEQNRIAWETMLGSAGAANAMLSDLQKFAQGTPFNFQEVEQSARRLIAMGTAAEDVIPRLTAVGNATASLGLGNEGVQRITLALGQMGARGKVSGDEMRQLTEAGLPAWDLLARAIGKSSAETQKLAETGQISADVFIRAFQAMYGEGSGRFGDLMARQSRTFSGALSNITDALQMAGATAFKPLFDALSELAQRIAEFVTSNQFGQWVQNIRVGVAVAVQAIRNFAQSEAALNTVKAALLGVAAAQAVLAATAIRAGIAVALANAPLIALGAIAAVVAAIVIANWSDISRTLEEFGEWLQSTFVPAVSKAWEDFTNTAVGAWNFIGQTWQKFWEGMGQSGQEGFTELADQARAGWEAFADWAVEGIRNVVANWNALVGFMTGIRTIWGNLGPFEWVVGKEIRLPEEFWTQLNRDARAIPDVIGRTWEDLRRFERDAFSTIGNALARTWEMVRTGVGDVLNIDIEALVRSLSDQLVGGLGSAGQSAGQALGEGLTKAAKPLVEELGKLMAELLGLPAREALEDTQYEIKRLQQELAVRGLLSPEERAAARGRIRELQRNVLPGQELAASQMERMATLAGRPFTRAQLQQQILENIRQQGGMTMGGLTMVTGGAVGVTPAVAPTKPPPTEIHLVIDSTNGDRIFDDLIEANGQAIIPPVIQLSAVRR